MKLTFRPPTRRRRKAFSAAGSAVGTAVGSLPVTVVIG